MAKCGNNMNYKIFTRTTGIYSITSKATGRKYVGQSKDIAGRWKQHLYLLKKGTHHTASLQEDYNKYDYKDLIFQIELVCSKKTLTENEIKIWDTFSDNYNGRPNGRIFPAHTIESKNKMSKARSGQKRNKHSSATKNKISESMKGNKHSSATKNKMSKASEGNTSRSKPVLQYSSFDFIAEYPSAKDASIATGIHNASIGKCCRGILKTSGGFRWQFK